MMASLENWKTITAIVSSAATVAAIAVGAAWAYWRFVRERTRWPRALLDLVVTHRNLTPEQALLNVTVKVHNAGAGLMRLTGLRVYVHRVLPLRDPTQLESTPLIPEGEVEAQWPCIKKATRTWGAGHGPEVEPQENDEYVHDFLISSSNNTLFIYTYLENEKRARGARELGWQITTFYDVSGVGAERHASNVPTMSEKDEKQQHPKPEPDQEKIEEGQQAPAPEPEAPAWQQEPRPEPGLEGDGDD
jgi:hypothetical protein